METLQQWQKTQAEEIEALRDETGKWQSQFKKDARDWKNTMLRETNALKSQLTKESQKDFRASVDEWLKGVTQQIADEKQATQTEIDEMKGEATDGNSRPTRKSSSTADLLGSTDGEGDQAEADDTSGRKGRRRASGTK